MNVHIASCAILFSVSLVSSAFAQAPVPTRILVGPILEGAIGADGASIPVYAGSFDCGEFSDGSSSLISLGGEAMAPSLFSDHFGLAVSASLSYASGRLTAVPIEPFRVLDEELGKLVQLDEEYRLRSEIWTLSFDLLARYKIASRLAVAAGPTLGWRLASTFTQTDNILGPGDYRFVDGQSEHPMPNGPVLNGNGPVLGVNLRGSYEIPMGARTTLVPGISIRGDFLSRTRDYSWRGVTVGCALSLLFDLSEPPQSPTDTLPSRPALAAAIEMFGIDEADNVLPAAQISVYETFYRQNAPLLPAVFFSLASSILPQRYHSLSAQQTDTFMVDRLAGASILDIQHQTLNIVGQRMREYPEAVLTLVGSISREEPHELTRMRAESVRSYLEKVWEIDRSRIDVVDAGGTMQRSSEATEDGRAENRRVELASNMPQILASVVTEQVVRDFDPPLIKMNPLMRAEAGIKRWDIIISQEGKQVARYSSETDMGANELTWQIVRDRIDSTLAPLVAELIVQDSTGAVVKATTQVPLSMVKKPRVVDKRVERSGDRERIAYQLVGFDFRSAQLVGQNQSAVGDIARTVRDGARITVVGYTDRIGNERLNSELAAERAASVAATIRALLRTSSVADVTIRASGVGVETERFTNDLPEGRMLSRGVSVVVEQTAPSDLNQRP